MKIGIMQPYIFPYIGYFQLIGAVDKFVLLDDVTFINRGWINRNKILINKQAHLFSIPLAKASQNKLIKDVEVVDANDWRQKFLKTIHINYKKAPYFTSVYPLMEKIVSNEERNIARFIQYSLTQLLNYLSIDTTIVVSSTIYNNTHLKGQERIIDICLKEEASEYINPIGGLTLYEKREFAKRVIALHFIKAKFSNLAEKSMPALSIIDLLMNHSKAEVQAMLNDYELE